MKRFRKESDTFEWTPEKKGFIRFDIMNIIKKSVSLKAFSSGKSKMCFSNISYIFLINFDRLNY